MKRFLAIGAAIALPVSVLVVAAVMTARPGPPAGAQQVLAAYLNHRNQGEPGGWRPAQWEPAAHPTQLTFAWSQATFSDGPMFRTTWNDRMAAIGATRRAAQAITAIAPMESLRPLPYPPVDAWCAQLQLDEAATSDWVVVALHQDLYNADWVVHELAAGDALAGRPGLLAQLGCR